MRQKSKINEPSKQNYLRGIIGTKKPACWYEILRLDASLMDIINHFNLKCMQMEDWKNGIKLIETVSGMSNFNPIPGGLENSIKGPNHPPGYWKKKYFFLKLDHFLRTFCKKCIFTIENPKKLLLDKQLFASSDAKFCRDTRNKGC